MELFERALSLFLTLFFLCFIVDSEGGFPDEADGFTIFFNNAIRNYASWLKDNNLDPSPPIPERKTFHINNNIMKLDGEITNYYFDGISPIFSERSIKADLKDGRLYAHFVLHNITFGGDYIANGTALNYLPLNGNGTWGIIYSTLSEAFSYNFVITPDGFVNITGPDYLTSQRPGRFVVALEFEGLMDEQGEQVKKNFKGEILDRFGTFVEGRGIDAVQQSFLKFLKEIYSKTHMSEIMSAHNSPTTTHYYYYYYTTTERSKKGRSSTQSNCPCHCESL